MVIVYLYGKFREKVPGYTVEGDCVLQVDTGPEETIASIMERLKILPGEVAHIFLNHQYSTPSRKVRAGDRLAIFPVEMAVLYRQYFAKYEE